MGVKMGGGRGGEWKGRRARSLQRHDLLSCPLPRARIEKRLTKKQAVI